MGNSCYIIVLIKIITEVQARQNILRHLACALKQLDMYHHKCTCISIFRKIELVDQSKQCIQIYLQNIANCINLQLPIVILKKALIGDMRHRKTYMYINFQQNWVNRSVIIVPTNLIAKNCKFHKFATCNSNFKKSLLSNINHLIIHI